MFSFNIYIDYTVRAKLRHLLHLYIVTKKTSHEILLDMLLDTILNNLLLYIIFTTLCKFYLLFTSFCMYVSVYQYIYIYIYIYIYRVKSKLSSSW